MRYEYDISGSELTPGIREACLGNGEHEGIECCCDECDYYSECYPQQKEQ